MARTFIDIHLRQWDAGKTVIIRDKTGATATLDGLMHVPPHQFILVELDDTPVITIDVPGVLTNYSPENGKPNGVKQPPPARLVDLQNGVLVDAVTKQPVQIGKDAQGGDVVIPFVKPDLSADAPLGNQQ